MSPTSIYFIFALTLLSFTSVRAGQVLFALYALHLGAQPFAVGILAATFSAFPMLLSWRVGRLADRFGSRWPLLFGALGGACGMLVPYAFPAMPALYIAAVMNGLFFAYFGVSLQNLVGLLSHPHDRARNFSNFSLLVSLSGFLGPLLSGFSIDHAGHAVACLLLVLIALVPAAMLALWGDLLPGGSRTAPVVRGIRDLLASSGLRRVLITSGLLVAGIDLFEFYMPIYGHGIGLSASAIGVVLATFSVAALLVRMVLPLLIARLTEEKVLAYAFFIGAASLILVPFFKSAPFLMLISFAFGIGMGCGQPITMMLTFNASAEGRSGEALGLRITINHMARVIVPIVFGAIGSGFGLFPVFWVKAFMLASGGALTKSSLIGRRPASP